MIFLYNSLRIGDQAHQIDNYVRKHVRDGKSTKNDLFVCKMPVANKELLRIHHRRLRIITIPQLWPYKLDWIVWFILKKLFRELESNWENEYLMQYEPRWEKPAKIIKQKYAVLHFREPYVYKGTRRALFKGSHRNTKRDTYLPLIEQLEHDGYGIVILNDRPEEQTMSLIAHCDLYIGNNSGPSNIAVMYDRHMLLSNVTPRHAGVVGRYCERMYKKLYQHGLLLQPEMILQLGYCGPVFTSPKEIRKEGLRYIDNTAVEIVEQYDHYKAYKKYYWDMQHEKRHEDHEQVL